MTPLQNLIVIVVYGACSATHWITCRRPYLWLPLPTCPFARWAYDLEERWTDD